MTVSEIRIYAEVLEQGLDIKNYYQSSQLNIPIKNIYAKKTHGEFSDNDSLVDRIRKSKDVDILISFISGNKEFPVLAIEYSTAVPTDDHKMQRSDVYFWGGVYKVPVLKIYPKSKGMKQNFGGGDKFTDELEELVAFNNGSIFIPIQWENIPNSDLLETNPASPSCINKSRKLEEIINLTIISFLNCESFIDYFNKIKKNREISINKIIKKYKNLNNSDIITNSTRFNWKNGKLIAKINRFGHAMDPDRGVLYFINMLLGFKNCISEIQVNRTSEISSRGGYGSLFDGTSKEIELIKYVKNIIESKHNVFSEDDALFVFMKALNLENHLKFQHIADKTYKIPSETLESFLLSNSGITSKTIFFLSSELILTDQSRNIICRITWDKEPIDKYISSFQTNNLIPLVIEEVTSADLKEDLITYSSIQLYKKIKFELLAVSYPGAQGDKALLVGEGRNVDRIYVDIIAYQKNQNKINVFLQENKDKFNKSENDYEKLLEIKNNTLIRSGLKNLFKKMISSDNLEKIYISIGSKSTDKLPSFQVDYFLMFDVKSIEDKTVIFWQIALINMSLLKDFISLQNSDNSLRGELKLEKIFKVI
jgi:hypothetical protein